MAMNCGESPEQQNAINKSRDTDVQQVIANFASKPEETEATLLGTFNYFKNEHVKSTQEPALNPQSGGVSIEIDRSGESTKPSQKDTPVMNPVNPSDDALEEETLGVGEMSGAMIQTGSNKDTNKPLRKFGNFVDDDDQDDQEIPHNKKSPDEFHAEGYSASFTQPRPRCSNDSQPRNKSVRELEDLPHKTESTPPCELSALVDEQYHDFDEDDVAPMINPGEIEDDTTRIPSIADLQKVTCLQITTTRKTLQENSKQENLEVCTDEVQAFRLDEDFDYDNVTLTPKFTAQEMEYLNSFKEPRTNT